MTIKLADFEKDGYELENAVDLAGKYPKQFCIPSENERKSLIEGDVVQLIFKLNLPNKGILFNERMWIEVIDEVEGFYVGFLTNIPMNECALKGGEIIYFLSEHIINIYPKDGPRSEEEYIVSFLEFPGGETNTLL